MFKPKILPLKKGQYLIVCPNGDIFIDDGKKVFEPCKWICNGRLRVLIKGKCFYVGRIVAEQFIPNPNGYKFVYYKDMDSMNNCVENLEWRIDSKVFNKEFYNQIDSTKFTDSDKAIYEYYKNNNDELLYRFIYLNSDYITQIRGFIKIGCGYYNDTILDYTYGLLLKRIKTKSIVPSGRTNQGFICYFRTMAYYEAKFNKEIRLNVNYIGHNAKQEC